MIKSIIILFKKIIKFIIVLPKKIGNKIVYYWELYLYWDRIWKEFKKDSIKFIIESFYDLITQFKNLKKNIWYNFLKGYHTFFYKVERDISKVISFFNIYNWTLKHIILFIFFPYIYLLWLIVIIYKYIFRYFFYFLDIFFKYTLSDIKIIVIVYNGIKFSLIKLLYDPLFLKIPSFIYQIKIRLNFIFSTNILGKYWNKFNQLIFKIFKKIKYEWNWRSWHLYNLTEFYYTVKYIIETPYRIPKNFINIRYKYFKKNYKMIQYRMRLYWWIHDIVIKKSKYITNKRIYKIISWKYVIKTLPFLIQYIIKDIIIDIKYGIPLYILDKRNLLFKIYKTKKYEQLDKFIKKYLIVHILLDILKIFVVISIKIIKYLIYNFIYLSRSSIQIIKYLIYNFIYLSKIMFIIFIIYCLGFFLVKLILLPFIKIVLNLFLETIYFYYFFL